MYKVIQINVTVNWGSTGRISEEIGQMIIGSGNDSYIAGGRNIRSSSSKVIKIGTKLDFYYHVLQTRLFDKHGLASTNATYKLIKQIKNINPDIIHLHNIHGYYLNYKVLFKFLSTIDIPVIWTLHDCWPFTGHCCYFSLIRCDLWKSCCFHCPIKTSYPSSLFLDRSKRNYLDKKESFTAIKNLTLVPVSKWLATEIKRSFLHKYPIKVIHNGIDVEIFSPTLSAKYKYSVETKFVILGVASVWSQRKGLDDFIKLSTLLPINDVIILVGLNEKQIYKLPKNIIGIKRTESLEMLAELYSSADVFLNLTWEDNFPTTNIEALSCGTPIVTYRTGGSIEAIDDATGIVVEQGDIKGSFEAINLIKRNGKTFYSHACRERALSYFNKQVCYAEYIQLYENIIYANQG